MNEIVRVAYLRQSSTKNKENLEKHKEEILELVFLETGKRDTHVYFYNDGCRSGAKKTPAFRAMIDHCLSYPPNQTIYCYIYAVDRMIRKEENKNIILSFLERKNFSLITIRGGFTKYTHHNILSFRQNCEDAIVERNTSYQRNKEIYESNLDRVIGGQSKFGYKIVSKNNTRIYEIDEIEAKLIRRIFQLNKDGKNVDEIKQVITNEGFVNRRKNPCNSIFVERILSQSSLYLGGKKLRNIYTKDKLNNNTYTSLAIIDKSILIDDK